MKDLDFEELDRAVNSVLGVDTKKPAEDIAPSLQDQGESPAPTVVEELKTPATPSQKPLIQKRSSGQFMEFKHASSSVRPPAKPPVSRTGTTIQSTTASVDTAPIVTAPVSASPEPTLAPAPTPEQPDVTEDYIMYGADDSQDTGDLDMISSELSELDAVMLQDTEKPLDTPFVGSASVEKRPLGAFALTETDESLLNDKAQAEQAASEEPQTLADVNEDLQKAMHAALNGETEDLTASVEETEPSPELDQEAAPEELKPDVQEVEPQDSGLTKVESDEPASKNSFGQQSDFSDQKPPSENETLPEELQSDVMAVESQIVSPGTSTPYVGTGSITPQYKEVPQKQSEEITPVFEVEPIKPVEKKKSRAPMVIIIILLLLIAAGAALYFFDPIGLFI